jgi:hypothetical protein
LRHPEATGRALVLGVAVFVGTVWIWMVGVGVTLEPAVGAGELVHEDAITAINATASTRRTR